MDHLWPSFRVLSIFLAYHKVAKAILGFILSEEFAGSEEIAKELKKAGVSLEALALPHLFPAGDSQAGLPRAIGQTWYAGKVPGSVFPRSHVIGFPAEAAVEQGEAGEGDKAGAAADVSNR